MSAQQQVVDNRGYPRVECRETVRLAPVSGAKFEARLADVSPDGLQAICVRADALPLMTDDAKSTSSKQPSIRATFDVTTDTGCVTITADCRLIHSSLKEDNQISFGLKFVQFQGDSRSQLGKFLVSAMEHA